MVKIDWHKLFSMSEDHELEKLEDWAHMMEIELGRELRILEIGSYHGKTTALLAQFGTVFAIDLWGDVDNGVKFPEKIGRETFNDFITNMIELRLLNRVVPMVCTSKILGRMPKMNFDFAFIDASHERDPVYMDIENTVPHMTENSLITFHDYMRPGWGYPPYDHDATYDPWWGVRDSVNKFIAYYGWSIYEHYAGIVALRRK